MRQGRGSPKLVTALMPRVSFWTSVGVAVFTATFASLTAVGGPVLLLISLAWFAPVALAFTFAALGVYRRRLWAYWLALFAHLTFITMAFLGVAELLDDLWTRDEPRLPSLSTAEFGLVVALALIGFLNGAAALDVWRARGRGWFRRSKQSP